MSSPHHSMPRTGDFFAAPGSPLHGKRIPMDWGKLTFRAKVEALVRNGYARDWLAGCSVLGSHAAAVKAGRKARAGSVKAGSHWWDR